MVIFYRYDFVSYYITIAYKRMCAQPSLTQNADCVRVMILSPLPLPLPPPQQPLHPVKATLAL